MSAREFSFHDRGFAIIRTYEPHMYSTNGDYSNELKMTFPDILLLARFSSPEESAVEKSSHTYITILQSSRDIL